MKELQIWKLFNCFQFFKLKKFLAHQKSTNFKSSNFSNFAYRKKLKKLKVWKSRFSIFQAFYIFQLFQILQIKKIPGLPKIQGFQLFNFSIFCLKKFWKPENLFLKSFFCEVFSIFRISWFTNKFFNSEIPVLRKPKYVQEFYFS